jgi:hypothetical protein
MSSRANFRPRPVDITRALAIVCDISELDKPDQVVGHSDGTVPSGQPGVASQADPQVVGFCYFYYFIQDDQNFIISSRSKFDLSPILTDAWGVIFSKLGAGSTNPRTSCSN